MREILLWVAIATLIALVIKEIFQRWLIPIAHYLPKSVDWGSVAKAAKYAYLWPLWALALVVTACILVVAVPWLFKWTGKGVHAAFSGTSASAAAPEGYPSVVLPPANWQEEARSWQQTQGLKHGWQVIRPERVVHTFDPRRDGLQPIQFCTAGLQGWRYKLSIDGVREERWRFGVYGSADAALRDRTWLTLQSASPGSYTDESDVLYLSRKHTQPLQHAHRITVEAEPPPRTPTIASCFIYTGEHSSGTVPGSAVILGDILTHSKEWPEHRLVVDVYVVATKVGGRPIPYEESARYPFTCLLGTEKVPRTHVVTGYKFGYHLEEDLKNPSLAVRTVTPSWLFVNVVVKGIVPVPKVLSPKK